MSHDFDLAKFHRNIKTTHSHSSDIFLK